MRRLIFSLILDFSSGYHSILHNQGLKAKINQKNSRHRQSKAFHSINIRCWGYFCGGFSTVVCDSNVTPVYKYCMNRVAQTQHDIPLKCCHNPYYLSNKQLHLNWDYRYSCKGSESTEGQNLRSEKNSCPSEIDLLVPACKRRPKELWPPLVWEPLELQGCIVSHFKILIE